MTAYRQNDDGTWTPAEPIGWREEHHPVVSFLYWLIRRPHCPEVTR